MSKKGSDAPDYTPLAEASKEAATIMAGLGEKQLAFSEKMYNENSPLLRDIANKQSAMMDQQMEQGKDYYDYLANTYRPLEKQIVADAQNFNTDAMRNQLATKAAADAGLAFNQTRQANERAMASMGVNPNSGRFAGLQGQSALQQAAVRAGAMTGARERAQQLGYARQLEAAGLGRNLSNAAATAYGGANAAGNSAGANYQSAGINYMNGMNMGANTIGQGQQMQLQGLSNVLNNQTQFAVNSGDSMLGDIGGLLGGAASAYTAFGSDRRLKENIKEIGVDQRTGLTLYEFTYISDPETRYQGVMADEVELSYPDAVTTGSDGFKAVYYDMLGIEFKELH